VFNEHDKLLCRSLAIERVLTKHQGYETFYGNFHKSCTQNDSQERWWPHMIGLLGEVAFKRITGMDIDLSFKKKGDKGFDFPDNTEVKTRIPSLNEGDNPWLLVRENDWKNKKPSRYVLVQIDTEHTSAVIRGQCTHEWLGLYGERKEYPGRVNIGVRASQLMSFVL
jgi:hypothetical protein